MQVTATSPATVPGATPAAGDASPSTLDYSAFLRLLIAEMKNQDPTKPMDSAQFVAQLASFSGVEQAVKTNAKLDAMMGAFALTQAESFIGRTIVSSDGTVAGKVMSVRVASDGAVAFLDNGQSVVLGPGITVA
jgi:flagellar basal-body rod modification protein FlgD